MNADPYTPPTPLADHPVGHRRPRIAPWAQQLVDQLDQDPIACSGEFSLLQARRLDDRLGTGTRGQLRLRLLWLGRLALVGVVVLVGHTVASPLIIAVAYTIAAIVVARPLLRHAGRPVPWRGVRLPTGRRQLVVSGGGLTVCCPDGTVWAIPWNATADMRIVDDVLLWMPVLPGSIAWTLPMTWVQGSHHRQTLRRCAENFRQLTLVTASHPFCWADTRRSSAQLPEHRLGPPRGSPNLQIATAQFAEGLLWECQGLVVWLPGVRAGSLHVTDPATGVLLPLPDDQ